MKKGEKREVRPLGYAMKVKELDKLITVVMRMKDQIDLAEENRVKVSDATKRLCEFKNFRNEQELDSIIRNLSWLNLMLSGASEDCKYIVNHFRALIAIIQMEAAERVSEQETINQTF